MQKKICLLLGLWVLIILQGCLLELFLSPKISPERLPGSVEMRPLKEAYAQHCAKCHLLIDPVYYSQGHSIQDITRRYIKEKVLNEKEAKMVVTYIQALSIQMKP